MELDKFEQGDVDLNLDIILVFFFRYTWEYELGLNMCLTLINMKNMQCNANTKVLQLSQTTCNGRFWDKDNHFNSIVGASHLFHQTARNLNQMYPRQMQVITTIKTLGGKKIMQYIVFGCLL